MAQRELRRFRRNRCAHFLRCNNESADQSKGQGMTESPMRARRWMDALRISSSRFIASLCSRFHLLHEFRVLGAFQAPIQYCQHARPIPFQHCCNVQPESRKNEAADDTVLVGCERQVRSVIQMPPIQRLFPGTPCDVFLNFRRRAGRPPFFLPTSIDALLAEISAASSTGPTRTPFLSICDFPPNSGLSLNRESG